MLVLVISYIFTIITPLHAHTYTPWEVCNPCNITHGCNPDVTTCQEIAGEEMCYWVNEDANGGIFDSFPGAVPEHEGLSFSLTRECKSDYDCVKFVNPLWHAKLGDGLEFLDTILHHEEPIPHPPHVRVNSCLRCCNAGGGRICTQTLDQEAEPCGNYFENFENPNHDTGAQVNSYGFNTAPCCPGEMCLDNVLGVCGVEVEECKPCISWNSQVVNFGDASNRIDDCAAGLICLLDDAAGSDISFDQLDYLTYNYGDFDAEFFGGMRSDYISPPRRLVPVLDDCPEGYFRCILDDDCFPIDWLCESSGYVDCPLFWEDESSLACTILGPLVPPNMIHQFGGEIRADHLGREYSVQNLRPKVTIRKGICVADDGFAQDDRDCVTDIECPSCMRCCAGIGEDGAGKCVRSSGEMCGLLFEGRGPCCCPDQYECCANECVTKSPTKAPTESPTPSPDSNSYDGGDDDSGPSFGQNFANGGASSDEETFGAKSGLGDNNNENNKNGEYLLSDTALDKVLFNVWCWIIVIIVVIIVAIIAVLSFCWIYKHKKRREDSFNTDLVQIKKEIDMHGNDV